MASWTPSRGAFALAVVGGVVCLQWLVRKRLAQRTPIQKFFGRLKFTQESPESIQEGREFIPRADDIWIVTYPKAGTTWMQQICHGLRTRGSMDFDEITCVVPWNICAKDCGQKLADEQVAKPRCYKSHDTYTQVPKGAKYIVIVRDPGDTLVSFHHFLCEWAKMSTDELTLTDFADELFCGRGSGSGRYWDHLASWIPMMQDKNVLFLFFEDLKTHLPECVKSVANFMNIQDSEAIAIATKQASFEFMRQYGSKFDDHFLAHHIHRRTGYFVDMAVGKVREGQVGGGKKLTPELKQRLDECWKAVITPRFGYPSYENFYARHGLHSAV